MYHGNRILASRQQYLDSTYVSTYVSRFTFSFPLDLIYSLKILVPGRNLATTLSVGGAQH